MAVLDVVFAHVWGLPIVVRLLGAAWVFSMICVPILGWTLGAGAERVGISIGVITQTVFVAGLLVSALPLGSAVLVIAAIPMLGWLFELVGSRTGVPFGRYHYTDVLKPQVHNVPVVVPAAWLMMIPASAAVGRLLVPGGSTFVQLLVSALAFTAWDLFLDPQMVLWDFWRWEKPGRYFGIPFVNFFGWFLCGMLALLAMTALLPTAACYLPVWPLFAVYILTWFFQTTAQLSFWGLYGSGIVGFFGMGVFILLVLI